MLSNLCKIVVGYGNTSASLELWQDHLCVSEVSLGMTASFWHRCWTTLGPLIEITDQDSRKVSGLAYSMVMGKHLLKVGGGKYLHDFLFQILLLYNSSYPEFPLFKVTRHEIQSKEAMWKMYEQYPHVIFDDFTSLVFLYSRFSSFFR